MLAAPQRARRESHCVYLFFEVKTLFQLWLPVLYITDIKYLNFYLDKFKRKLNTLTLFC
jgi:hypothetical protein